MNNNDILSQINQYNTGLKKQSGSGNILSSLLPTAGGVGGGLGGAALGASLGSIVPGIGTAIGGLLGGLLGSTGGSALGKFGENAVEGKSDLGEGVGQEALLGALTGIPLGAGFKLAKAGTKLATGAGKTAASDLVKQAGAQTVGGKARQDILNSLAQTGGTSGARSATQKLAEQLDNTGGRMLASQSKGALSGPLASEAPDIYKAMNRYGYNNVNDFQDVASKITGNEGAVNLGKMNMLANSGKTVTSPNWQANAMSKLKESTGLTKLDETKISNILRKTDSNLQNQLNERIGTSRAAGMGEFHPEDAYRAAQDLQRKAYDSLGGKSYAGATDVAKAKFDVLNTASRSLKDSIDSSLGREALTPAIKQDIIADLGSRGVNNPKLLEQIQSAKTFKDLSKVESPFVRASQIGQQTQEMLNKRGINVTSDLRSSTLFGTAANAVAPAINRAGGKAALAASKGLKGAGAVSDPSILSRIVNASGRRAVGGLALSPFMASASDQSLSAVSPDMAQSGQSPLDPTQLSTLGQLSGQPAAASALGQLQQVSQSATPQYSLEQLFNDIQTNSPDNAATLIKLYELANPTSNLTATQQKAVQAQKTAQNALSQLAQNLQTAGGGSGPLGYVTQGLNSLTGGAFNPDVAGYDASTNNLAALFARALGQSGALSDQDIQNALKQLPKVTDSPEAAQRKLQILQSYLDAASVQ